MLVLARKISETHVIGDNIRVTVTGTDGNQVKIRIAVTKDGMHILSKKP